MNGKNRESLDTMIELIDWVKDRMASSKIEKSDRVNFFKWMLKRASERPELDDTDLRNIRKETM